MSNVLSKYLLCFLSIIPLCVNAIFLFSGSRHPLELQCGDADDLKSEIGHFAGSCRRRRIVVRQVGNNKVSKL